MLPNVCSYAVSSQVLRWCLAALLAVFCSRCCLLLQLHQQIVPAACCFHSLVTCSIPDLFPSLQAMQTAGPWVQARNFAVMLGVNNGVALALKKWRKKEDAQGV